MAGLSPVNRALMQIPKRAEKQDAPELHESFVDAGVADNLGSVDHQVLYGRRGTGKTHALSYLASEVSSQGDIALVIDLRTVGSPDGVFALDAASNAERAARLLIDLLGQVHDSLLNAVLADPELIDDGPFVAKADALLASITSVRVSGEVQQSTEVALNSGQSSRVQSNVNLSHAPSVQFQAEVGSSSGRAETVRETRTGVENAALNFSDIARALRELEDTLTTRRIWLLLDEWSSIPIDLQPFLAEFLLRCVLPLQRFTVKIAAIEQQSRFREQVNGRLTGLELGADIGAHANLDDYLVFEGNEERSRDFFRDLFFRHLTTIRDREGTSIVELDSATDFVRQGFADARAFDELVRAAEGVPRDALYIAARCASLAGDGHITVPIVREAARYWYQTDKARPLEARAEADSLLHWIIQRVIREKRARAFLVSGTNARDPLLLALFDARVLHIVRRGYSAQDDPGTRYDVWGIDYGAYVDLLQTKFAPLGALPIGSESDDEGYADVDVPSQDLRAIRRAILDLDDFYSAQAIQPELDGLRGK